MNGRVRAEGLLLTLVWAAACGPVEPQLDSGSSQEVVWEERLAKDLEIAALLDRVVPLPGARDVALQPFLAALGAVDEGLDRDLGTGARRLDLSLRGGYTRTWMRLLVDGTGPLPRIARLELSFDVLDSESWPLCAERLKQAWTRPMREVADALDFTFLDAAALERLRAPREALLGPAPQLPERELPAGEAWALGLLTDPLEFYSVGRACGYSGMEPTGHAAIQVLLRAGRWDLIRVALRGANPEGRVYAAQALTLGQLTAADRSVIEVLCAWDLPISSCSGCSWEHVSSTALLDCGG